MSSPPTNGKKIALLAVVAFAVPIIPFAILGELPGERWLEGREAGAQLGAIGAGLLAADVFLPVPSTVVGAALGYRLGLVAGFAWCWGGLVLGNLCGYAAGLLALRRVGVALPATRTALALFLTRPIPILAEAVAIASGAGRVPLRTFAFATVVGNAVYAAALAGSGAALVSERWAGVALVVPMGLPVLGWWLLKKFR